MIKVTGTLEPYGKFPVVEGKNVSKIFYIIDTEDELNEIHLHEGIIVYCNETNKFYQYNKKWQELDIQFDNGVKINNLIANTITNEILNSKDIKTDSINTSTISGNDIIEQNDTEFTNIYFKSLETNSNIDAKELVYDDKIKINELFLPKKIIKKAIRTGNNYNSKINAIDFGFYFEKDKTKLKLLKNNQVIDFDFTDYPKLSPNSPIELNYTTKIKINEVNSDDVFELIYYESYLPLNFDIRLIAYVNNELSLQNKKITKFIVYKNEKYYLDSIEKQNSCKIICNYKNGNRFLGYKTYQVKKCFPNAFYIPYYKINEKLPFYIEIWRKNKTSYGLEKGGHYVPVYKTNKNLVIFGDKALKYATTYKIRLNINGNYTDFKTIKYKHYNIFGTNQTGSENNYLGFYRRLEI